MPPSPRPISSPIYFGPHIVTPQVFYTTRLTYAFVNLRPLIPGHVLVSPHRCVPRLHQLSTHELIDLFSTVQTVGKVVEEAYGASSLNVAVQDGAAAGQSVEHVHAHVIPRKSGDMDVKGGGDKMYEMLEGDEGDVGQALRERETPKFPAPDVGRKDRSEEEMREEAEWLRRKMRELEEKEIEDVQREIERVDQEIKDMDREIGEMKLQKQKFEI